MGDFRLSGSFLERFVGKQPGWGPIGYFTYKTKYARPVEGENRTEEWWETVRRVVEGTYSIQKEHCERLRLPWNHNKAQKSAQEMYTIMWDMKFLPPGRGLWMMGTDFVGIKGSAALNNCSFVSTKEINIDFAEPFCFLMDMSMLGVGVGGDTKGADTVRVKEPRRGDFTFVVEDSREGWVELVRTVLNAYAGKGSIPGYIDYSQVRPKGELIKTFGGVASGPEPLAELVQNIQQILDPLIEEQVTSTAIVDLFNAIGKCVVSGNVRRCMPADTRVYTSKGFKRIADINIGDFVSTPNSGYKMVTNRFKQGLQSLVRIHHQDGYLDCTPNHRVAVLTDTLVSNWRRADELKPGDRLFFPRNVAPGKMWTLPEWSYEKMEHSTTCQDLKIPVLDTDMAWLMGLFATDGYTYPNYEKKGFNAYVSLVFDENEYEIAEEAKKQLERFGTNVTLKHRKNENSWIVHSQSKQLAWYFAEYIKQANTCIQIPYWIKENIKDIRLAYLAGVMDGDGAANNKPIQVVSTVYKDFALDIKALLGSCSIESRFSEGKEDWPSRQGWQKQYFINLITLNSQRKFQDIPELKKTLRKNSKSSKCNGFPGSFHCTPPFHKWGGNENKQINLDRFEQIKRKEAYWVPIQVYSVEQLDTQQETYDIEVEDAHCFVAEGIVVHNSAEIMLGDPDDIEFLDLKDHTKSERHAFLNSDKGWRWTSNNSIFARIGMDYSAPAARTRMRGEIGYFWLDTARRFGRLADPENNIDMLVEGCNPCGEQSMESYELCTLVETFPARHENYSDYERTLKFAYLYAKTVTLIPTHNARTNAVMLRNRRIGTSQSGIAQSIRLHGIREHYEWCDKGYKYLRSLDNIYSRWLCIPESIKITSVKPSGTISLLPGATPGIHFPLAEYYWRTQRFDKDSPFVKAVRRAGYRVEEGEGHDTVVVYFPVKEENFWKSKEDVTIWEQLEIAAQMQAYWSDNQVSVTVTFKPEEAEQISLALQLYETRLKSVSFLPLLTLEEMRNMGYKHPPYQAMTKEEYEQAISIVKKIKLQNTTETEGFEKHFCDSDHCTLIEG